MHFLLRDLPIVVYILFQHVPVSGTSRILADGLRIPSAHIRQDSPMPHVWEDGVHVEYEMFKEWREWSIRLQPQTIPFFELFSFLFRSESSEIHDRLVRGFDFHFSHVSRTLFR